jgi:hypothetical protein
MPINRKRDISICLCKGGIAQDCGTEPISIEQDGDATFAGAKVLQKNDICK